MRIPNNLEKAQVNIASFEPLYQQYMPRVIATRTRVGSDEEASDLTTRFSQGT